MREVTSLYWLPPCKANPEKGKLLEIKLSAIVTEIDLSASLLI